MSALRRVVLVVAVLHLVYFGIEFAVGLRIRSVALLADSAEFFEDAAVNLLIFFALTWSAATRARVGMALSAILLLPVVAFVWSLWGKLADPVYPPPLVLGLVGLGALAVNLTCAALLARFRTRAGSLSRAAFLAARNDALANVGIILTGVVTAVLWPSVWPDVIVGLLIAWLNAGAAREIWREAWAERSAAA